MAGVSQHDRALVMDDIEEILKPLINANPVCTTAWLLVGLPVTYGAGCTSTAQILNSGSLDTRPVAAMVR